MEKHCFTLDLKDEPELINTYIKMHRPDTIWKEIPEGISKAGILEMEIFLWQNRLFMIIETEDGFDLARAMEYLSGLPLQKEWEETMEQYQRKFVNTGNQAKWQKMHQIFRLSDCLI